MFFAIISILFFVTAIFFTILLRFPQRKVLKEVFNKGNSTSLQTLLVSLASHIGTGNLVGITTGIILGGPGVIFWMWIYAFFSSSFSLVENTYAVVYQKNINGEFIGGASHYIERGLNKKKLGLLFAICLFITNAILFPPLQINTIVMTIDYIFDIPAIYVALAIILIMILFVFRGTKTLLKLTDFIVPIMASTYVLVMSFLILLDITTIPSIIILIIKSAFNIKTLGISSCIYALSIGVRRSIFSNEAGLGTTPTFSAMSNNENPTTQGYFQMLGVFIDTLVICTLTGVFILQSNVDLTLSAGADVIIKILELKLGNFGKMLAMFFLLAFAFSSILGEFYMAEANMLSVINQNQQRFKIAYRVIFSLTIFFGAFYTTSRAMSVVDYGLVILGSINLIAIFLLEKRLKLLQKN